MLTNPHSRDYLNDVGASVGGDRKSLVDVASSDYI